MIQRSLFGLLALTAGLTAWAEEPAAGAPPAVPPSAVPEAAPPAAPSGVAPASSASAEAPFSEEPLAAKGRITAVRLRGLKRVEEAAILAAIGLRAGDELSDWAVRRDVKAVYGTGFVDDVRVDSIPAPDEPGSVILVFDLKEKPAIREVKLEGNKKLDDDALFEVIDITAFSVLNESDVKQNIRQIRDKYIEKGYYLAEVEPVLRDTGDGLVELTFQIVEHRKVLVQRIDITGNDHLADRKITRYLKTKEAGMLPWLSSKGAFNEASLREDADVVRSVFLEEGYVDVKVDEPSVFLSPDKRYIYITMNVTEGTRYRIGKLKISGDFVEEEGLTESAVRQVLEGKKAKVLHSRWAKAREEVGEGQPLPNGWEEGGKLRFDFEPDNAKMKTGDWFKLTTLQTTMQEITDLYGDQGYAFANVIPDTQPDGASETVDITFVIQRGDKVRINRIDITGNDPTYDKVVRREIPINEGDIYSGSAIKDARQRLDRLGYFEEVKISTPRASMPDSLDMKVDVTEQPTGSFSVGAGFSNIENFMLTLNVSKNNFLGLGYVMSAAANVSRSRQQWNLQLYDPYFLDSRWTARIDGYSIARQFIEDEYQRGGDISIGRYLDRRDDMRMEFTYTFEDTGLNNLDAYKERLFGGELYRNGLSSSGGLSLVVDKRNNRIQATRGIYGTASASLAGGFRSDEETLVQVFGGDFNYYETKINFRAFHPVIPGKEWVIFKYNGTLGRIGSTDGTMVPYIQRFRAGGINSVRGYDWYTLGPAVRATGFKTAQRSIFTGSDDPTAPDDRLVVGGTETWINNFELEEPIIKAAGISTVLFFDAGNAFGDPWGNGHVSLLDLRASYGFGLRWFSPMGPLRFEWGFPINPKEDERKAVFDFSIGSLF